MARRPLRPDEKPAPAPKPSEPYALKGDSAPYTLKDPEEVADGDDD